MSYIIRVLFPIFNLSTSWKLIELILLLFWAESSSKASFYSFLVKLTKKLMKHLTMEVRIMNSSFINSIVCSWRGVIMGIALIVCPCFYQIFTVSWFLARKLVFLTGNQQRSRLNNFSLVHFTDSAFCIQVLLASDPDREQ